MIREEETRGAAPIYLGGGQGEAPGLQALSLLSLLQEGSLEGRATESGLLTIKRR